MTARACANRASSSACGNELLLARRQVFHFHLRPFVAEENRNARAELLGGLKLFANLRGSQRKIDAITAVAQRLNLRERVGAAFFLRDDDVNIEVLLRWRWLLPSSLGGGGLGDQFPENHIAHGETERRQRHRAIAELLDQDCRNGRRRRERAISAAIEHFEDDAGVVGEAAHNPEIDLHKLGQAALSQSRQAADPVFRFSRRHRES